MEPKPDKSISSRAFFLFENKMNLVQVTIELDLNPTDAENIHQSYLRLKGLDKIVTYCQTIEKYLHHLVILFMPVKYIRLKVKRY
ncbi:hypothetical protein BH23THE1_BH23THE1_25800 [soil metagenome]